MMMIPITIQSSLQVWSAAAELPNLSGWAAVSGLAALTRTVRARYASPHSPPAKLDSDKFGDEAGDETGGLIESCTRLKFSINITRRFRTE